MKTTNYQLRIVVPVYNAKSSFTECIKSIISSLQELSNWNVIIVDNGKNHGLEEELKEYPVEIIVRDKLPSAAYARNEGAANFEQGILLFFDSDVILEKKCVRTLIQPILEDKCDATFGSYSKDVSTLSYAQKFKQLYVNYVYSRDDSLVKNFYWTAICAIKAEIFHKVKGFDIGFKGANSEDQEIGIRLSREGYKILPVLRANGVHKHSYTVKSIFVNDLKKGITSMKNIQRNNIPITDNRHASKTDIAAVFFATLTVVIILSSVISFPLILLSLLPLFIWGIFRYKLLSTFAQQGFLFCIKSGLLLFSLELVRTLCVVFCIVSTKSSN